MLFLITTVRIFSAETEKFTILTRSYRIDGLSRPAALEKELKLPDTPSFQNYKAMTAFVDRLEQKLLNLRLYSSVETELSELDRPGEEGKFYHLTIELEDAWTFIPLVYPKYDTNTNMTLESKILYSNFFGTLLDFKLDGYMEITPEDEIQGLSTGLWEIDASLGNINWGDRTYTFQWVQQFDRITKTNTSETIEDYTFHKSTILLDTEFPLGGGFSYKVAPAIIMEYFYEDRLTGGSSSIDKEPFSPGLRQNLVYDQVNWYGNFREGLYSDLGIMFRYSFYSESNRLKGMGYLESGWYKILQDYISLNLRNVLVTSLNFELPDLGIYMRGVPDEKLYGHSAVFFNSSLPLKVLDLDDVVELQLEPFSDLGLTWRDGESFSPDQDFRISSGFSLLFFFDRLTSIQVRTSFGWDLLADSTEEDRFEFLLSTSLYY